MSVKQNIPKTFHRADLILSGERSECTKTYMRTRTHDKIKNGFLKGEGYTILGFLFIILLLISSAHAKEAPQSKLGQFSSWTILKGLSGEHTYCYAFSEPYYSLYTTAISTRSPYLLVIYKGHRQVTFSSYLGFEITDKANILLEVNGSDILLDATPPYSGKTYSSAQDIQLLNEIVESNKYVKIKSFTKFGGYVADYYKVDGILKAINFMEKNCN